MGSKSAKEVTIFGNFDTSTKQGLSNRSGEEMKRSNENEKLNN